MKKSLITLIIAVCWLGVMSARQPAIGYRGFVDWNGEVAPDIVGTIYGEGHGTFYTGATTTHGYQLKPWLFVGGGAGVIVWPKYSQVYAAPVYADCRFDLGRRLFSPFLDVRLGGNIIHGGGVYLSAVVGFNVRVYHNWAINIGIGYTMTGLQEYYTYNVYDDYNLNHWGWQKYELGHQYDNTLALRLGFEF